MLVRMGLVFCVTQPANPRRASVRVVRGSHMLDTQPLRMTRTPPCPWNITRWDTAERIHRPHRPRYDPRSPEGGEWVRVAPCLLPIQREGHRPEDKSRGNEHVCLCIGGESTEEGPRAST